MGVLCSGTREAFESISEKTHHGDFPALPVEAAVVGYRDGSVSRSSELESCTIPVSHIVVPTPTSSPLQERKMGHERRERIAWQNVLVHSSRNERLHWNCFQNHVQQGAY